MRWRRIESLTLVGLLLAGGAMAADEANKPADEPPELKALDRFRGTWKGTLRTPEGEEIAGESTSRWVLGGKFLQTDWTLQDTKGMILRGYDQEAKKYRMYWFTSDDTEAGSQQTGTWDEATKTFTTTGTLANGRGSVTTTAKFPNDDTEEWEINLKLPDVPTPIKITGTNKRQKK